VVLFNNKDLLICNEVMTWSEQHADV